MVRRSGLFTLKTMTTPHYLDPVEVDPYPLLTPRLLLTLITPYVGVDPWRPAVLWLMSQIGPRMSVDVLCSECRGRGYVDVWAEESASDKRVFVYTEPWGGHAWTGRSTWPLSVIVLADAERIDGDVLRTVTRNLCECYDGASPLVGHVRCTLAGLAHRHPDTSAAEQLAVMADRLQADGSRWGYWLAALIAPRVWGGWYSHPARKALEVEVALMMRWNRDATSARRLMAGGCVMVRVDGPVTRGAPAYVDLGRPTVFSANCTESSVRAGTFGRLLERNIAELHIDGDVGIDIATEPSMSSHAMRRIGVAHDYEPSDDMFADMTAEIGRALAPPLADVAWQLAQISAGYTETEKRPRPKKVHGREQSAGPVGGRLMRRLDRRRR